MAGTSFIEHLPCTKLGTAPAGTEGTRSAAGHQHELRPKGLVTPRGKRAVLKIQLKQGLGGENQARKSETDGSY